MSGPGIWFSLLKTGSEQASETQWFYFGLLNDRTSPEKQQFKCNTPSLQPFRVKKVDIMPLKTTDNIMCSLVQNQELLNVSFVVVL